MPPLTAYHRNDQAAPSLRGGRGSEETTTAPAVALAFDKGHGASVLKIGVAAGASAAVVVHPAEDRRYYRRGYAGGGGLKQSSQPCSSSSSAVQQQLNSLLSQSRINFSRSGLGGGFLPDIVSDGPQVSSHNSVSSSSNASAIIPKNGCSSSHTIMESLNERSELPSDHQTVAGRLKRHCAQKQWDIANIVPVMDVRLMTAKHWAETFALERKYLPVDWSLSRECSILGVKQADANRDHRHRIVKWMSEACGLFNWASQTFFTAVHAWDAYMTIVSDPVVTEDLPKLSASCLYFGAQLVESAADENVKTLDEFTEMCPEVLTSAALREIQAHLVDTLQGISLVRRTPTDFLLLFLAQMQIAPDPCPQLYKALIEKNLLDVLWDLTLTVALVIYTNGLILDGLPGSRWVIAVMLRVLEYTCPALRLDNTARDTLRQKVFHLPPGTLEMHQTSILDPIIKYVWHLILDSTCTNRKSSGGSTSSTSGQSSTRKYESRASYDIIRHTQPPNFSEWCISFPSFRVVQDVSTRLRAVSFDSCTPPNIHPNNNGSSISAAKRMPVVPGEKGGRRYTATTILPASMSEEIVNRQAKRSDVPRQYHPDVENSTNPSTMIHPPPPLPHNQQQHPHKNIIGNYSQQDIRQGPIVSGQSSITAAVVVTTQGGCHDISENGGSVGGAIPPPRRRKPLGKQDQQQKQTHPHLKYHSSNDQQPPPTHHLTVGGKVKHRGSIQTPYYPNESQ